IDRNILLTDFGLAIDLPADTLSTTNTVPGPRTPMYCAPEVSTGHRRGRLADIFSLGAVFLEMLTVYSGHENLARFTDFRQSNGGRTYASNIDKIFQWMDNLSDTFRNDSWSSAILFLCQNMLQTQRDQRP